MASSSCLGDEDGKVSEDLEQGELLSLHQDSRSFPLEIFGARFLP